MFARRSGLNCWQTISKEMGKKLEGFLCKPKSAASEMCGRGSGSDDDDDDDDEDDDGEKDGESRKIVITKAILRFSRRTLTAARIRTCTFKFIYTLISWLSAYGSRWRDSQVLTAVPPHFECTPRTRTDRI